MGLILPALISGVVATTVSTASGTCPPISAVRLSELPSKGTCSARRPVAVLSISPAKCTEDAVP